VEDQAGVLEDQIVGQGNQTAVEEDQIVALEDPTVVWEDLLVDCEVLYQPFSSHSLQRVASLL